MKVDVSLCSQSNPQAVTQQHTKKPEHVATSSLLMEKEVVESFQIWSQVRHFENGASAKAQLHREKAVGSNLST